MNLPGFTAESSLVPAMGHYGGATKSGTGGGVLPMQLRASRQTIDQLRRLYEFQCCQWINNRMKCVSKLNFRGENCACERGPLGPWIRCGDPLIRQFEGF